MTSTAIGPDLAQNPAAGSARTGTAAHERAARGAMADAGLMPDEVESVLCGRPLAHAVPVLHGEAPVAYAARAFSEIMVAYLT